MKSKMYLLHLHNKYIQKYKMGEYSDTHILKIGIVVAGITTLGLIGSYLFFSNKIEHDGARLTGNIIGSKIIRSKLIGILKDPKILETSSVLINQIIKKINEDPETKTAIISFLNSIINDITLQDSLVTLAVNFFSRPEIENKLADVLNIIFSRHDVKNCINNLVSETCSHEPNREKLSEMIKSVLSNPDTKTGLVKLINSMIFGN